MQTEMQRQQVAHLYKHHAEMPYISPNRDLDSWLEEVALSSSKLVPKRNMERTQEGLLPGHIILLWRVQFGTYTTETVISKYFEYSYGIDGKKEMDYLVQEGYTTVLSAHQSLNQVTASLLKKVLKDAHVSHITSLKKEELVQKVNGCIEEKVLATYFTQREYALTAKGSTTLANNIAIVDKHPKKKF